MQLVEHRCALARWRESSKATRLASRDESGEDADAAIGWRVIDGRQHGSLGVDRPTRQSLAMPNLTVEDQVYLHHASSGRQRSGAAYGKAGPVFDGVRKQRRKRHDHCVTLERVCARADNDPPTFLINGENRCPEFHSAGGPPRQASTQTTGTSRYSRRLSAAFERVQKFDPTTRLQVKGHMQYGDVARVRRHHL